MLEFWRTSSDPRRLSLTADFFVSQHNKPARRNTAIQIHPFMTSPCYAPVIKWRRAKGIMPDAQII